jgi:hydrogenase nickel incorporation protein HypA/HybF
MHELSIAQSIVDIVQQHVPDCREGAVEWVRIQVGQLAGVVPESLEFCFSVIVSDTPLSGARLEIDYVATKSRCTACDESFFMEKPAFRCPSCGGSELKLISGTELQVVEIQIREEQVETV